MASPSIDRDHDSAAVIMRPPSTTHGRAPACPIRMGIGFRDVSSWRMANSTSGDSVTDRLVRVLETFTPTRTVQTAAEIGRRAGLPGSTRAPHRRRAGRRRAARARRRPAHPHRHAAVGARDPLVAGAAAAPGRDAGDGAGAGARARAHAAGDPGAGRGALPRAPERAGLGLERHAHRRAAAAARLVVGTRAARVRRPRPAGAHPRGAAAAAHARDDHRSRGAAPQARRGARTRARGRARLHRVGLDGRRRAGARRDRRGRRRAVGRAAAATIRSSRPWSSCTRGKREIERRSASAAESSFPFNGIASATDRRD